MSTLKNWEGLVQRAGLPKGMGLIHKSAKVYYSMLLSLTIGELVNHERHVNRNVLSLAKSWRDQIRAKSNGAALPPSTANFGRFYVHTIQNLVKL